MRLFIPIFFFSSIYTQGATLYTTDSLNSSHPLVSDYVKEIILPLYKKLKPELEVEIVNMPSQRLAKLEDKGQTDFITGRAYSPIYDKNYHQFQPPIAKDILVQFIYDSKKKNKNLVIGLTRGDKINKQNKKILQTLANKFIELPDQKTLIKMFNKKRIDGFTILSSEWKGVKKINKLKREYEKKDLFNFNSYHYIHKKHSQYIPQIEKRIKQLEAEKKWDFVDFVKSKRPTPP